MPDETPNNPTTQTATASPQGAQTDTQSATQTGNLIDRITSMAFPDDKPLPATAKIAAQTGQQAPAQAPAATVTPSEDDPPAEVKSEAGKTNWKMLRVKAKERDELEAKWKAAQTEIETYKKNPPKVEPQIPADYEEIKKREAEYSEKLKLLDIERHPQFQKHFDEKFNQVFNAAKQVGGQEHGEKIAHLLKLPDSQYRTEQLDKIAESLSPSKQSMLGALLMKYEEVSGERNSELTKAKENYAEYTKRVSASQKAKEDYARAQAEQAFEQQLQSAQKELPAFQKRDGDEAWNKQVDATIQSARNIYAGNLEAPDLARAAQWAAVAPMILQDAIAKGKELEALKAENARLKGAKPNPGAGADPKEPEMPANMTVADRIVYQAQKGGLLIK